MTWIFARVLRFVGPIVPTRLLLFGCRGLLWWSRVVEGVSRERIDDLWRLARWRARADRRGPLP